MLKNQHRYDEISADRSIPIPHQPPHLLQFDILMFPNQKENLQSHVVFNSFFANSMLIVTQPLKENEVPGELYYH